MYNYFYIIKDCLSNTWDTTEILRFLRQQNIFVEKPQGIFTRQAPFITLSLMKVKKMNSWSSLDFDPIETNYINIVTSEVSQENALVKKFFREFENYLGYRICQENV